MQPYPYNRDRLGKNGYKALFQPKLVRAAEHPSVRRGVEKDLETILRKPSQNNSHRWNHAPRNDSKTSSRFDLKQIRMPGRGLSFLRQRDEMLVRRMPREEDEVLASPVKQDYDLFNHFNDILSAAGREIPVTTIQKPADSRPTSSSRISPEERGFSIFDLDAYKPKSVESKCRPFPAQLPAQEIVARTVESLPKITLRNGHSLKYSSLVLDVCRKSIMNRRNLEMTGKEETTVATLMGNMNTTIRQAARENIEMLLNMDPANMTTKFAFSSESPHVNTNASLFPKDINSPAQSQFFRTPTLTSESPFLGLSADENLSEGNSFGYSLMHKKPSEFVFDNSDIFND